MSSLIVLFKVVGITVIGWFGYKIISFVDSFLHADDNLWDDYCLEILRIVVVLLNVLSSEDQFKSIFDLRLGSTLDKVGDLSPFVSNCEPFLKEINVLLQAPLLLIDRWVQSCEPSLTALLSISGSESGTLHVVRRWILDILKHCIIELFSDSWPVSSSVACDKSD